MTILSQVLPHKKEGCCYCLRLSILTIITKVTELLVRRGSCRSLVQPPAHRGQLPTLDRVIMALLKRLGSLQGWRVPHLFGHHLRWTSCLTWTSQTETQVCCPVLPWQVGLPVWTNTWGCNRTFHFLLNSTCIYWPNSHVSQGPTEVKLCHWVCLPPSLN